MKSLETIITKALLFLLIENNRLFNPMIGNIL